MAQGSMARPKDDDHRKLVVISDVTGEVGCLVSATDGEISGVCKYSRITGEGWKVFKEWLDTPHPSYKAREQ